LLTLTTTATLNLAPLDALRALLAAPPTADVGIPGADKEDAQIGRWNEFGTDRAPARSFLRSTAAIYRRVYADALTAGVSLAVRRGNAAIATKAVRGTAQLYHRDILRRIDAGIRPPNAPSTLARKSGTTPLIDTGAMRASILWRMR
jgi:hypothetical protein